MATDTTHPLLEERTDVILWLFSACGQWLMQESRRRRQATDDEPAAGSMTVPVHLDRKLLGKMAYFHNLEPILHDLIRRKTLSSAGIPRRLTESWEAAYLGTVVANADLLTVLFALSNASQKQGVPLMVLKGPTSIARIYKDSGLRTMADLDVFCPDTALAQCGRIARSLGFRQARDVYLHHVSLFHERLGVILELHFALYHWLAHRKRVADEMWTHRQWVDLEGVRIPVMSVEDQLVFGLAHIISHDYRLSLKQYLDFLAIPVLLRSEIDLARVFHVLDLADLRQEFVGLCGILTDLLGVSVDLGAERQTADARVALRRSVVHRAVDVGFVSPKKAGGEFERQAGLASQVRFMISRLVPPLSALQVVYALPSRRRALLMRPHYIWATLKDVRRRKRAEGR
jgi:hypothetical protein